MLDQDAPLVGATIGDVTGRNWDAAAILDKLDLGGRLDDPTATLSGGETKRVALARALVEVGPPGESGDDVLLILDEPTNHLDIDAIGWLEERLAAHRGGLLLVSHDRHVLDRVTTRILELDRGHGYVHDGGYAGYLEARAEREAQAERQEGVRRNLARSELAWLRRGAPARTSKPKARIEAATAIVEGRPEAAGPRGRARPRLRRAAARRQRHRPAPHRAPLRRRSVAVPRRRPVDRPPRAARDRRAQRRRQVDAARRHRRHAAAGRGHRRGRHHRRPRDVRPAGHRPRPDDARRPGRGRADPAAGLAGRPLPGAVLVRRRRPAVADRPAVGRRAAAAAARADAAGPAQRAAARRADERPRPRHAAGAGGRARGLARRRRRRQPRPGVPRAHRGRRARDRRPAPGPAGARRLRRLGPRPAGPAGRAARRARRPPAAAAAVTRRRRRPDGRRRRCAACCGRRRRRWRPTSVAGPS